jgi:hypothetical protein
LNITTTNEKTDTGKIKRILPDFIFMLKKSLRSDEDKHLYIFQFIFFKRLSRVGLPVLVYNWYKTKKNLGYARSLSSVAELFC